jgi:MraZ protein
MFRGTPVGSVDGKFRLKMPSAVRTTLLAKYENPGVFVTSIKDNELRVYPLAEWEQVEQALSQSGVDDPKFDATRNKRILRRANANGADDSLDNQGRILIPRSLREDLGMRGEVHMQWARNHIVVMSADAYRNQLDEDLLTDEDLAYADDVGV